MANALPHPPSGASQASDLPVEPVDNRMYLNLSIAFLVGIVFLFGMFILMMILLAQAA